MNDIAEILCSLNEPPAPPPPPPPRRPSKYFKHAHRCGRKRRRWHSKRDVNTGRYVTVSRLERRYEQQRNGQCVCRHPHAANIPCMPVLNRSDPTRSSYWRGIAKKRRLERQKTERKQLRWRAQHGWYR